MERHFFPGDNLSSIFTARKLIAFTGLFVLGYIFWIGPERFYYESFGTWILSPIIYTRLLPPALSHWLVTALVHYPILGHFLCFAPLALLGIAMATAIYSIHRNSLAIAFVAWLLVAGVFSVYHYVQPMGITLVRF